MALPYVHANIQLRAAGHRRLCMSEMCGWAKIVSWPLVLWYFQGLLTPAIAVVTVVILWKQGRTNAQKLTLDLYDRRLRVLEAVRGILAMMYTTVSDDKKLFTLVSETRGAEFLFGPEIKDYIETVWRHASRLSDTHRHLREILDTAPAEARRRPADVESEEVQWAFAEARTVADRFKGYLDLGKL